MKTTTGDFLDFCKYDARAGKFFKVEKHADGNKEDIELPLGTKFAIDFGSFEAGYMTIGAQGPVRIMTPYIQGTVMPPGPQDKNVDGSPVYKPGFWCKIAGNAIDGVREWCSNAATVLNSMDDLYQSWLQAPEAAAGQIPIVCIAATTPVKTGSGARSSTNYRPEFRIEGWTPRPPALGERTVPAPGATAAPVQPIRPAAPAQPAVAPMAPVAPAPAAAASTGARTMAEEMPFAANFD